MNKLTDRQMSAAKRIYDICIWFLDEFDHTDGFNDLWLDFKERGAVDPELAINDHVEKLLRKVNLLIDQEYFDLRGCEVYNVLCEFVSEDLQNTYSGKLSYAYRFEADSEANPSVSQDYDKAMIRLNSIIDQYT